MRYIFLFFTLALLYPAHSNAKGHSGHGCGGRHGGHVSSGHLSGSHGGSHGNHTHLYCEPDQLSCLNGYVVYNNDTLAGMVTINNLSVSIDQCIDAAHDRQYNFLYSDKALKTVAVSAGWEKLYLTRPMENDRKLLRVIHAGKLNIYDDRYSFPSANNINTSHMKVAADGKLKPLGSGVMLDPRHPLIKEVNKAYSLNMKTCDLSWNDLISYINNLD